MNETIGVKGGHNDSRRTLKIKEKQKKKLLAEIEEKELKELEKKVKKQQKFVLIKTLPLIIVGQTLKTLYDTSSGKKDIDLEDEKSKWRIKEYGLEHTTESLQEKDRKERESSKRRKIIVDETGRKIIVDIPVVEEKQSTIIDGINIFQTPLTKEEDLEKKREDLEETQEKSVEEEKKKESPTKVEVQKEIPIRKTKAGIVDSGDYEEENKFSFDSSDYSYDYDLADERSLPDNIRKKIGKLKARKIIDEYERQLKDIRYELRQLIFEYNVLVDEKNDAVLSQETEVILERLSFIISKVEELKRKIKIEDLDKYDDNYIYTLVEGYLEEFKDKKLVAEIKDSPLYILISEKLDELDSKKDDLNKKVEEKKERFEIKEEKFDKLKEKYFNIDRINKDLLAFQYDQDSLLKEVREKVANATSVSEKVEVEVEAMNKQSRKLLKLLTLSMLFPGSRAGRSMATTTAAYLYFLNQLLHPKTTTKKYRVITVKDYSRDIEKSISSLSDAMDLLDKTGTQIDKMIVQIKDEFKDYLGVLPEADELLANLKKIKEEIDEKEYEMEKMKQEQEIILEKNNAKVKTIGEYPM